jgi:hypothetical protein
MSGSHGFQQFNAESDSKLEPEIHQILVNGQPVCTGVFLATEQILIIYLNGVALPRGTADCLDFEMKFKGRDLEFVTTLRFSPGNVSCEFCGITGEFEICITGKLPKATEPAAVSRKDLENVGVVIPSMIQNNHIYSGFREDVTLSRNSTIEKLPYFGRAYSVFYNPPGTEYLVGPLQPSDRVDRLVVMGFPVTFFMIPETERLNPMFFVERGPPIRFFGVVKAQDIKEMAAEYSNLTVDVVDWLRESSYPRGSIVYGTHKNDRRTVKVGRKDLELEGNERFSGILTKARELDKGSHPSELCLEADGRFLHDCTYPSAWSMRLLSVHVVKPEIMTGFAARHFQQRVEICYVEKPTSRPSFVEFFVDDCRCRASDLLWHFASAQKHKRKIEEYVLSEVRDGAIVRILGPEDELNEGAFREKCLRIDLVPGGVVRGNRELRDACRDREVMVQMDVMIGGRPDTLGFIDIKREMDMDGLLRIASSGRNKGLMLEKSFCVKRGDDVNAREQWQSSGVVGRVRDALLNVVGRDEGFRPVIVVR